VKAYWKDFSPIDNIGKTPPPAIVLLGTKDEYVPVETCKRFERLMEERGGRCDLHLYQDKKAWILQSLDWKRRSSNHVGRGGPLPYFAWISKRRTDSWSSERQ